MSGTLQWKAYSSPSPAASCKLSPKAKISRFHQQMIGPNGGIIHVSSQLLLFCSIFTMMASMNWQLTLLALVPAPFVLFFSFVIWPCFPSLMRNVIYPFGIAMGTK
ncbi:hypothetical protein M3650_10360 [Paenibacillus sp. MER TA 81-3]|uniref:hypothetical protein n=1 Tax=Paenibacillus sp. MER TA 81-3 TaxID=2939573 RepID=UPI00203FAEDC|nr:hypothetical protein [Paenibacillus sp. MER TA 81-3]MCM3339026.1 hypothetical protein [Paenibacillus sp. MER TA 81-3]